MKLDFWNNPLAVTALRLKYRTGSPTWFAGAYVLGLVALAGIFIYTDPHSPAAIWTRNFYCTAMGFQTFVIVVTAMTSARRSMNEEVNSGTLDFQRIVSLSPRSILVGKLLGESVVPVFFVIASVPVALFCVMTGGVPALSAVFVLVQQITTIVMVGSLCLLHSLRPAAAGAAASGGGIGAAIFGFIIFANVVAQSFQAIDSPIAAIPLGLLTPILAIVEAFRGAPFSLLMPFFVLGIPYVLITPFTQLLVAALAITSMERRLVNPAVPLLSRAWGYFAVLFVGVIVAAQAFETVTDEDSLRTAVSVVIAAGIPTCLIVSVLATPSRHILTSTVWRNVERGPTLRERFFANRHSNREFSLALCAIQFAVVLGLVLGAQAITGRSEAAIDVLSYALKVLVLASIMILAAAASLQCVRCMFGERAVIAWLVGLIFLNVAPFVAAMVLDQALVEQDLSLLASATIINHMLPSEINRFNQPIEIQVWPMLVIYLPVMAASWYWIGNWTRHYKHEVKRKLAQMEAIGGG